MTEAYRADHIGSLLRPKALLDARAARASGRTDAETLRRAENEAIDEILAMQRDAGIDVVTDGEYRRNGWMGGFWESVEGFEPRKHTIYTRDSGGEIASETTRPIVTSKLRRVRNVPREEAAYLKDRAGAPYKITLPSPVAFMTSGYAKGISDGAYPTREDLARDLARLIREQIDELVADGVPYVQIDAPQYTHLADPAVRARATADGWDPDRTVDAAIAADAAGLEGLRGRGTTLGFHLCRGNVEGRWMAEGGYDSYAEKLFNAFDVDRLLLEYDTDRAGGFEPLRHVPRGTMVVLGLISSKVAALESRDDLMRRIEDAARYVPIEDLALSPQCGFATRAEGNPISMDDQRRKLELVAEVARAVWH